MPRNIHKNKLFTVRRFRNVFRFIAFVSVLTTMLYKLPTSNIINIWLIIGSLALPIMFSKFLIESDALMYRWKVVLSYVYKLMLEGAILGFGVFQTIVLNRWYNNPDNGQLEPLFLMLTACVIVLISIIKSIKKDEI